MEAKILFFMDPSSEWKVFLRGKLLWLSRRGQAGPLFGY